MKGQEMTEIQNKQEFIDATDSMGGSAFPFVAPAQTDKATGAILSVDIFPGMTLRDWFAGQALTGIYACRDLQLATLHDQAKTGTGDFDACMAKQAYSQADAMIAARKAGA